VSFNARLAAELGLTPEEREVLRPLATPARIQDFINAMPANFEHSGDTCYSVRAALRENRCHCIEGAFIAACALMLHGSKPLLLDFQANGDDDHVCALFKVDGHWGAISKSNSLWLRWRDPIYRSIRELAMSYFHEYVNENRKTLRRISKPFDIGVYRSEDWITGEQCWDIAIEIDSSPHVDIITSAQARRLRRRDVLELRADTLKDRKQPKGRT
jgi:hypothetical protein